MSRRIKDVVSEYFINVWHVNPEDTCQIEYVDARQFLKPQRIDLICKLLYIDSYVNGDSNPFARELYKEHLRSFTRGNFTEDGTEEKNSFQKYIDTFNSLIDTCSRDGFSDDISVVPVGSDGNILDGSHRTSIAIYFNLQLPIVRIPDVTVKYDYEFFQERQLNQLYLDYMAYEYVNRLSDVFSLCLWPVADSVPMLEKVDSLVASYAEVIYKKRVKLTYDGVNQIVIHTYAHHDWIGDYKDGYSGSVGKTNNCFKAGKYTTVYFLAGISLDEVLKLKSEIRNLYQLDKHAVHITDNKDETMTLARIFLNDNSIKLINYGSPLKYSHFLDMFFEYRSALLSSSSNPDNYIIDTGAAMAIWGLRDTSDIDYVTSGEDELPKMTDCESHEVADNAYGAPISSILFDPRNYLFYRDVKFLALDRVLYRKIRRKAKKDRGDVRLIRRFKFFKLNMFSAAKEKILFVCEKNYILRKVVGLVRRVNRRIKMLFRKLFYSQGGK